jgi:hypothetical protein
LLSRAARASVRGVKRAETLEEARKLLDPRPLDFTRPNPEGADAASDPGYYMEVPERFGEGFRLPGPLENIRQRLLTSGPDVKIFLSGHVGSGKSTELSRLAVGDEITRRFHVVSLRFEEQEWATLDSPQVLFRLAGALYERHKDALSKSSRIKSALEDLNKRLFDHGVRLADASVEVGPPFFKIRQNLKLSEHLRRQFRTFGETQQSVLQDVLRTINDEIEEALSQTDGPDEILVIVDDLDKVRGAVEQKEIFDTNLNALLAPPFRVVYTLPTGVSFGEHHTDIRRNVEHLYPVRVLRKAGDTFNPEDAYTDERRGFFEAIVATRVQKDLMSPDAIRLASIYSGGVLREFFRLLREGIRLATYNRLDAVDGPVMRYALKDAMLRESVGLYAPDYDALLHTHRTNALRAAEDRRYLDLSRVLECYNDAVWFEVNPLLWQLLGRHSGA